MDDDAFFSLENVQILENQLNYDQHQIQTLWNEFVERHLPYKLIIQDLCLSWKGKIRLDKVSFEIVNNSFHVFIGNNGAGKSTTIKSIVGIIENYDGNIYFDQLNYLNRNLIAYVPDQQPKFPKHISAKEYLLKTTELLTERKLDAINTSLNRYIEMFDMQNFIDKNANHLSTGEKQKVLLVSAFLLEKRFIVLDEPFANLDATSRTLFMDELKHLSENGVGVFLSSHNLKEIADYVTYATFIKQGKIIYSDHIEDQDFILDFYNENFKTTEVSNEN